MLSTLLAACGGGTTSGGASGENTDNGSAQQNEGSTTTALSGTIEIDGSSTLHPLTEAIAEEFGARNPDVRIPIGTGGTGGGFKRFNNGEIQFPMHPVLLKTVKLKKQNPRALPIMRFW